MGPTRRDGRGTGRTRLAWVLCLAALALAPGLPRRAPGIELLDGWVEIHGYAETQVRALSRDYQLDEELDLSQWYWIGNVELEFDLLPEGWGPINLLSAYVRAEARYDCVWSGACGLFSSANTYGNRAQRLPERLSNSRKLSFSGSLGPDAVRVDSAGNTRSFVDTRRRIRIPLGQDGLRFAVGPLARPVPKNDYLGRLWNVPALGQIFLGSPGLDPNGVDGNLDPVVDPGLADDDVTGCLPGNNSPFPCRYAGAYVAERIFDYRFGISATRGPNGGNGSRVWGPWRPKDEIAAWAVLRDRVNPYNENEVHPVMTDVSGTPLSGAGDLPFRPQAQFEADSNGDGQVDGLDEVGPLVSRGLYYPNTALRRAIADPDFDQPKLNFSQRELALNHGYAQEQTRELKEAYLDIEVLDHALWVRAGRQTIVWGKTELFRSQDQFNPQDLGLSSLPSLEESRIPLWALRAIYSFYDVGPFEDVRLEGAVLVDQFQPLDFGRCGEPYAPPQACDVSFGLFAHGLVGLGLAGQYLPRAPWDDFHDIEGGGRLEWRWDRLSFALSDFVGYPDVPHIEIIHEYTRNVDPRTGRPRRAGATGPCIQGNEPDCLGVAVAPDGTILGGIAGDFPGMGGDFPANVLVPGLARPYAPDVLAEHHANQQLFATICASTVGATTLSPSSCAFNVWNNQQNVGGNAGVPITSAQAFSAMLQGYGFSESGLVNGKTVYATLTRWTTDGTLNTSSDLLGDGEQEDLMPLVPLHVNSNPSPVDGARVDGPFVNGFRVQVFSNPGGACEFNPNCAPIPFRMRGLSPTLTVEQEALLGCGNYWGIDCDIHGFDILNAEASALFQSWPGFEGTSGGDWDPFDASIPQPGTIGFDGGPVCTRFDRATAEALVLPGCRGVVSASQMGGNLQLIFDEGYSALVDGCVFAPSVDGLPVVGFDVNGTPVDLSTCVAGPAPNDIIRTLFHPFAGCLSLADELAGLTCTFDTNPGRDLDAEFLAGTAQVFRSEMAALSWNLLMVLVGTSTPPDRIGGSMGPNCDPTAQPDEPDGCSDRPPDVDQFDVNDPERLDGCSFRRPFLCRNVSAFQALAGPRRALVRAGGNPRYGRRDFQWHAGGIAVLDYQRRNVLGFSMDFPEDVTKTNWGFEFTWFDKVIQADNDEYDGLTTTQHFNMSISVDRPTFIRFLNAGRTFLFNTQVFLRYIEGYETGFTSPGPFTATGTFFAATAYHQDRLIPTLTLVHDFNSVSGGIITGLTYRYTTHLSVSVGAAAFYGGFATVEAPITSLAGTAGGVGEGADRAYVEQGISQIRDRDELYLRVRYTF